MLEAIKETGKLWFMDMLKEVLIGPPWGVAIRTYWPPLGGANKNLLAPPGGANKNLLAPPQIIF